VNKVVAITLVTLQWRPWRPLSVAAWNMNASS